MMPLSALNHSVAEGFRDIDKNHREIIAFVIYIILCGSISVIGSVANVVNMMVFYRQGLDTTINISFFSLAVSDLCSLVFQQFYNLLINPMFVALDLPIVYMDLQYLTSAVPREMFVRVTCLITAFITAERCLCVVFPLHVKRIITPRRTTAVIAAIYFFTLVSPVPVYFTSYYTWKFYPDSNRTLLTLAFTSHHVFTLAFVYLAHSFFTVLGFLSVLTFTLILTYKLKQKSEWRQAANVDQDKAKSMSRRDTATIRMVVLIAAILVVCYTPAVLLCLSTIIVPEFFVIGRLANLNNVMWSLARLFGNINSSVNIFLYYKMSCKFRETFKEMFSAVFKFTEKRHKLISK